MGSPSDAAIISASGGDPARFGELFDRHATTLHRYLVRRVGASAADELLGETFRIAFEKRSTYDVERESARPWLYGIATNLVARHARSEGRRLRATAAVRSQTARPEADATDRVVDAVAAASALPHVLAAVRALPPGERDALLLHVWEDLRYEEIAVALDVPVGTVRSRLNRARSRLRELEPPRGEQLTHADVYTRHKERLMTEISAGKFDGVQQKAAGRMYPRLAYRDERAALPPSGSCGCSASPSGARRAWSRATPATTTCSPGSSSATGS